MLVYKGLCKNLAKNVIFKKIQIHLQVILLFKSKHYSV
jgi:hypothetical protein